MFFWLICALLEEVKSDKSSNIWMQDSIDSPIAWIVKPKQVYLAFGSVKQNPRKKIFEINFSIAEFKNSVISFVVLFNILLLILSKSRMSVKSNLLFFSVNKVIPLFIRDTASGCY